MKEYPNLEVLKTFTLENIPDLDVAVLGALELFEKEGVPKLTREIYQRPLVVGSGNAEATGRIIFGDLDAVFASESTYQKKLEKIQNIDGVILLSASGAKHAPIIAKKAKALGKPVTLLTNNPHSEAAQIVGEGNIFIFPKNREPYTYNTSTYLGMILGATGESPHAIHEFIKNQIDQLPLPDFSQYDKYFLIIPPRFSEIVRMLEVKFIELFGRRIARDVETSEYLKHATTVVPANELFISFGEENTLWGDPQKRLNLPLPEKASYGAMMAVGYYIIGKIQKQHPPYFKENLVAYTQKISTIFGHKITPIVE